MRLLAALLLVWTVGCAHAPQPTVHGVPNFGVVVAPTNGLPGIYRGGEPTPEGWRHLRQTLGVTRDVQLDWGDPGQLQYEMEVVNVPIPIWNQLLFPPSLRSISHAVNCIQPGTFVHCAHGADRTGLVVAEFEVWRLGRSRQEARKEMMLHGFHAQLLALEWFWQHREWYELRAKDFDENISVNTQPQNSK